MRKPEFNEYLFLEDYLADAQTYREHQRTDRRTLVLSLILAVSVISALKWVF